MYHFFVKLEQIEKDSAYITGKDVNHIANVLRMRVGEKVLLSAGGEWDYLCEIIEIQKDIVKLIILSENEEARELPAEVVLLQALPKSDKLELIIQKSVELGVSRIIPVQTLRCVVKLDEKKAKAKLLRWNMIAEAAAKQSKRSIIPHIESPMTLVDALEEVKNFDMKLMPYENADGIQKTRALLHKVPKAKKIAILIGPEGGFEDSEVLYAKELGFEIITLGRRILRAETATFTMLGNVMIALEGESV